ncbi:NADH-quinone oxidoreductase subunit C [Parapedobacter indicus]|uniref:NADH-quinone oxidoreductase subunit C n=1 Tax=Parapedobacter indicus TaxID=1477437 RepID=A0A1I3J4C0_9SPHI|nr:NADH-quinone oxidoreductase subunit C [Parapedobacter indicus]PPL02383.1 NADH dehydrogenase subunit C [Parapedobacter indicus]SFI54818.1 NADH dehydrogenase subunit C [Parapedobacter indicus]
MEELIIRVKTLLAAQFGDEAATIESSGLQPALVVESLLLRQVCLFLRDHVDTYFDFLSCISAVDDGVPAGTFTVVYHLASIPYNYQLTLKVIVPNDRRLDNLPSVPSVSSVWRTADWHEREAFDLMGIYFEGHPDLRRILLPEDWEGYPLRKDYEDAEMYHGIPIK